MYGETITQNTKLYLDFENRKNRIALRDEINNGN